MSHKVTFKAEHTGSLVRLFSSISRLLRSFLIARSLSLSFCFSPFISLEKLRPKAVLEARAAFSKKEISAEELRKVEDQYIAIAAKHQQEVGLLSITDGSCSSFPCPKTDSARSPPSRTFGFY